MPLRRESPVIRRAGDALECRDLGECGPQRGSPDSGRRRPKEPIAKNVIAYWGLSIPVVAIVHIFRNEGDVMA